MKQLEIEDLLNISRSAAETIRAAYGERVGGKPSAGDKGLKRLALVQILLVAARDIYDGYLAESEDVLAELPNLLKEVIEDESQN